MKTYVSTQRNRGAGRSGRPKLGATPLERTVAFKMEASDYQRLAAAAARAGVPPGRFARGLVKAAIVTEEA